MMPCDHTNAYYDDCVLSSTINISSTLLEQLSQNGPQSKIFYSNVFVDILQVVMWNSTS